MKCILPTNCIGYLSSDSSACLIRAVPYQSHLLLLLNHVGIVLNYVVLRALRKIDVYLISTLDNKNLYLILYFVIIRCISEMKPKCLSVVRMEK